MIQTGTSLITSLIQGETL